MPKIQFFPLDVTYKIIDETPVIHLFGTTIDGKQICVLDSSFQPYLWVIPKKGKDIEAKLKKVKKEEKKDPPDEPLNRFDLLDL